MLELHEVWSGYGGIDAVRGVSMRVAAGELVTIIGANGAGKTTLLRTISGLTRCRRGDIRFEGQSIATLAPDRVVALGVVHVPQGRAVFASLDVRKNLLLGAYRQFWRDRPGVMRELDRVYELFPVLRLRAEQLAGTLSGGQQQMLAIGRALMSRPRLLLLDEPSMGLAPTVVREIFTFIAGLAREGLTMLLVEQNARLSLEVADRAYVLHGGVVAMEGPASELAGRAEVREAYLGGR
ncbi:MAG: ABC transporter ATP-binding protein [Candidatus Rokubacteria bacterium]|nr:ABC transporter ATP-binding protein [Candidatus Rokubacteria bacterium]